MNKLICLLVLIFSIVFMSCTGGKTKESSLENSIVNFKSSIKSTNTVNNKPEKYSEIITDTILNNGYSVRIKSYAEKKVSKTQKYRVDSTTTITNKFKNWISEVTIKKDGFLIFNEIIDSSFYIKNNQIAKNNLPNIITSNVEVSQESHLDENYVYLTTGTISVYPKENTYQFYTLKIDHKGHFIFNKLRAFKEVI